ncbi:hypothetical protein MTR67_039523, partial [Solanum verrucosum]
GEGIQVESKKTEAVKNWPRPLSALDIWSFLEEACEKSFHELKNRLTSAPILTIPKGSDGFVVYYDASRISLNCVLMKHGKVIAYPSRQLKFCKSFQKGVATQGKLSTTFHPQIDGQVECTINTLEYMLRACVINFKGNWDDYLPLIEFSYNNSYHSSIGMSLFEDLFGSTCRSHVGWFEAGKVALIGPELVHEAMENVQHIR